MLGRLLASLACLAVSVLATGCLSTGGVGLPGASAPTGRVALSGPTFGEVEVVPGSCASGEHQLFLGADLRDEAAGITARLVVDPLTGPAVRFFRTAAPGEASLIFGRADCEVFDLSLARTGWQIDDVWDLRLALELRCRSESGDSVMGRLEAPSCH